MSSASDPFTGQPGTPPAPPRAGIDRREALRRVSVLLGGVALLGGSSLLTGCSDEQRATAAADGVGEFTPQDIAFLDEVSDTILPTTQKSPGAKAAQTGAFMALMVTDSYKPEDRQTFREGMRTLDEACRTAHGHGFMEATPEERTALLTQLDREQKEYMDARGRAQMVLASAPAPAMGDTSDTDRADRYLSDQRKNNVTKGDTPGAVAISADAPPHYFRMMKELALLGFFTSEIGYTQAMRYRETPGRYDPCVDYTPGETIWAPHA